MLSSADLRVNKVGLIGVGTMGKCMLERLIENGFEVVAFDPFPAAQEFAKEKGAVLASSPAEVASEAKLILMSLPAAKHIFEVISGEKGLIDALTAEHVIVDTSTVSPLTSQNGAEIVAAKGASYVDTSILGRPSAVGNWLLPAGGSEIAIEFATPVLLTFAKKVVRVGDVGAGNALKLLNQLMFSVINGVSAEVMALAKAIGVDKKAFYDVVANSDAATVSGLFKETARRIVLEEYDNPTFTIELLCKDADLGIQMAKDAGVTPLIAGFVQMFNENAKGKGLGKQDTSSIAKVFEEHFKKLEQ
ncbi:NAD(P)-dependent oxidoreductase [Paenibacillus doosanensis]|uniref:NAD(P)-dependent oxidoreductase n=1 Tax=Paenibacillus doosanensis TaxID=1229154 RepID=UPI0021807213|nr:NAD(P)-dependent oxidoreductase [Paenibacillus doosanensis]MCS7461213.1 NAD(P)-dependent oxidoreductase [Paenibacillus doosanensis]